ncbi:MAG: universal stress protein [Candidatus Bathyarchaeota archaeon]
MIDKILVPIDGSKNSEKSLKYACWLAEKVEAKITVLYVVPIPIDGQSAGLPIEPLVEAGEKILEKAKKTAKDANCKNTQFILRQNPGNAGHEIVKYSQEQNISLIIMNAKGHSKIKHLLLGSVSETVTKYAKCSVMIVK